MEAVTTGTTIACSMGVAPSSLVAGAPRSALAGAPMAVVTDVVPTTNISTFSMCVTPTNPAVAAATTAALGVLTPAACLPVPTGPWAPGSASVAVDGVPAVTATSTCFCAWGGVISVTMPSQGSVWDE